jgi:hypothetical protein
LYSSSGIPLNNYIYIASQKSERNSFTLAITLEHDRAKIQSKALLDSGAFTSFINQDFVRKHKLRTFKLENEIQAYNADSSLNKKITDYITLKVIIENHMSEQVFLVANIGHMNVILGMSFLKYHNPQIDWRRGELDFSRCPSRCQINIPSPSKEESDTFNFPHLEEVANDEFSQLNNEPWDNSEHYNRFISYSHDPLAHHIRGVMEDKFDEDLGGDKDYWSKYVPEYLHDFGDVFSKKASERMPVRKPYDHSIEILEGSTLPKPSKLYPLNPAERNSLDSWIDEELAKGYIRPSKSPTASPVFFVKKKDGSLRLVQDYRALNSVTKKNKFPIPRIPDLIDRLSQSSIFTSLDLRWGYNNIRIKEGDEEKAAFITHKGLFEPTVMYFGFCNAPSTFQHMMNEVLREEIATGHVVVYIDDILIFTDDAELHLQLLQRVLTKLRQNDLFAKPEKCHFMQPSVEFLGLVVGKNSIKMDPKKVEGVSNWPTPTKVKHVQAFLGLANFYRRFIQGFAQIVRPLTKLTCKDTPWIWESEQEEAFKTLKTRFTTAPILQIPNEKAPFRLETDSSDFATGAVLEQLGEDKLWHPVAFYSKSLNEHERNYEIYDKELLSIIRALEEYRHYIEGHPEPLEIWSDHQNLTYFRQAHKITRRQARWSLFLTRFNFILKHRPGKTMLRADPLSRRPDHEEGVNSDNSNQTLLKPEFFAIKALQTSHLAQVNDAKLLENIRSALEKDTITHHYKQLLNKGPREFGKSLQEWNFENGLLLHRGKVYVPKDQNSEIRLELLKLHHDTTLAGHQGRWKTLELLSRNYWWPGMSVDVKKYVQGCDICQRNKATNDKPYGLLQPNEVPAKPWDIITIDLITQLPPSAGYTAIVVVVDRLGKRAHFFPHYNTCSATDVADILFNQVFKHHGIPLQIISDRGVQFASKVFKEFCTKLGIRASMSTAYHPQTDGQTERVNQTLEQYLRIFCNNRQENWAPLLTTAEFAYNNAPSESTKMSPFYVEYGYNPRMAPDLSSELSAPSLETLFQHREEAQEQAQSALVLAAERAKWYFDIHKREVPFKVGDKVLLKGADIHVKPNKLAAKNYGPFEIIEQYGPVTFKLKLPATMSTVHPVYHASKMIKFRDNTIGNRKPHQPGPIEIEGNQEYEVAQILNTQIFRGKVQYLVSWQGYDASENTWEPLWHLKNSLDKVKEFHLTHPNAPKPTTWANATPVTQ